MEDENYYMDENVLCWYATITPMEEKCNVEKNKLYVWWVQNDRDGSMSLKMLLCQPWVFRDGTRHTLNIGGAWVTEQTGLPQMDIQADVKWCVGWTSNLQTCFVDTESCKPGAVTE